MKKIFKEKIMAAISKNATTGKNAKGAASSKGQPRGIRNNNPLNIRHSTNKWKGMAASQKDRAFVQFTDRKYGYRAAFVLIRNYIGLHHANTIGKIIARWAPSSDGNNTQSYISFVSKTSGIKPDTPLRFSDQKAMVVTTQSFFKMQIALTMGIVHIDC